MSLKTLRIWNHPNRNIIKLAILFQAPCIKYDLNRLINNKKLWLHKSRYSTQGIKLPLKYFNRICLYLPWALCVLIWPKRLLIIIVFGLTQIGPLITKLRSYELKGWYYPCGESRKWSVNFYTTCTVSNLTQMGHK